MTRLLFLLVLFAPSLALAQRNFDKVEIKTTKLRDGVYMLQGAGGNMGLVAGKDATFLIDDQFAPLTPKILAAVKKVTDKPITFVINTHWHGDHSGGNANLAGKGATIVAHQNVRKRLEKGQVITFFKRQVPAAPKAALPVITFTDKLSFHLNGDTLTAHHHPKPAHTDGDAIIRLEKANVVHTGDTFFNGFYPFIDGSSGGSLAGMVAAANATLKLVDDQTKIIPGHGPLATKADLIAYRDMLAKVHDRVMAHVDANKTVDEIVKARPTQNFDKRWGNGFLKPNRWVKLVAGIAIANKKKNAKKTKD